MTVLMQFLETKLGEDTKTNNISLSFILIFLFVPTTGFGL